MTEDYWKPLKTINLKRPAFSLATVRGDRALEHPTSLGVTDVSLLNYLRSGNYRKSSLQLCRQYLRKRNVPVVHGASSQTTRKRRPGAVAKSTLPKPEAEVSPVPAFKELSSLPVVVHSHTSIASSTSNPDEPTKTVTTKAKASAESKLSGKTASHPASARSLTAKKQKAMSEEKVKSTSKQTSRIISDPGPGPGPAGARNKLLRSSPIRTGSPQSVKIVRRKKSILSDVGPKTASVESGKFDAATSEPNVRPGKEEETPAKDASKAKAISSKSPSRQTTGSRTGPKTSVKSPSGKPAVAAGKTTPVKGKPATPPTKAQSVVNKSAPVKAPSKTGRGLAKGTKSSPKVDTASSGGIKPAPGTAAKQRPKMAWTSPATNKKNPMGSPWGSPLGRGGRAEGPSTPVTELSEQKGRRAGPDQAEKPVPVKKKLSTEEKKLAMLMELVPPPPGLTDRRTKSFLDEDPKGNLSRMGYKPPQWEKRYAWRSTYAKWLP